MLNIIWAMMIILAVVYAVFSGNMQSVGTAFLDSSTEAVSLCITMTGIMAFWCGILEVAQKSGLTLKMTRMIAPFVNYLFPGLKDNPVAKEHISTNIISNVLGMGWAATPAGIKAMKEMAKVNKYREWASNEMCTFLIVNISSLQLIPVNIIAYRSQYGSANPALVAAPGFVATLVSTLVAVVFCRFICKRR